MKMFKIILLTSGESTVHSKEHFFSFLFFTEYQKELSIVCPKICSPQLSEKLQNNYFDLPKLLESVTTPSKHNALFFTVRFILF